MQTLGLASEAAREDNFFQRLFWPTVSNLSDGDVISRRGFWVSLIIGVMSCGVAVVGGHPVLGLLAGAVFVLGAMGIRQLALSASVMLTILYGLGIIDTLLAAALGQGPPANPLLGLVSFALLLSTVRATLLARRRLAEATDEMPESQDRGLIDLMVNRAPKMIWPVGRYFFYVFAGSNLLLYLLGFAMIFRHPQL